jgi:two-component system, LytTR family, response regulator
MIRCILIEDEPLAQERLTGYVRRFPLLDLAGVFDNAHDACEFLKTSTVDLVFLDIRLGGRSGIELLEAGAVRSKVILTTAHQQYAVKAYDLDVADYLLKPFTFERFARAVDRVHGMLTGGSSPGARDCIFVKTEARLEKVDLADIVLIEGQRDYRRIHTVTKRIMTLQSFATFERQLSPEVICRVHKSYMVALGRIESIERWRISIGGMTIPVSETYRERFMTLVRSANEHGRA